ncbi:MAG: DUF1501 domain-containing protein [Planctomycetota bacterium]
MNDNLDHLISRRSALRKGACAALGLAGLSSQLLSTRTVAAALQGQMFSDYKALVCIFLFGGNDSGNTLIPIDGGNQNHADYALGRGNLAIPLAQLGSTTIAPANTAGRRFALHPSLTGTKTLFDQGNVAVVANVGTLLAPTTRMQYFNRSVALPTQLFAHEIQQQQWQLSRPDALDGFGWGGRLADMLQASGIATRPSVSMNISIAGVNQFQSGRAVSTYVLGDDGPPRLSDLPGLETAYLDMLAAGADSAQPNRHAMERSVRDLTSRAITNNSIVRDVLSGASRVPAAPVGNGLARQLQTVAQLIEVGQTGLGHTRQVFFVAAGGFDNHDGLIGPNGVGGPHAGLLNMVDSALMYFWAALGQINRRDAVTTFTASDFGRTFNSNGNGSDHGWAGHHFVMGGSQVRGGRLYGSFPNIQIDGPEDTGLGRFIPSTSVDQYGFELARWMGVPLSEMPTVFPNIMRFLDPKNPETQLRFMN